MWIQEKACPTPLTHHWITSICCMWYMWFQQSPKWTKTNLVEIKFLDAGKKVETEI